MPLINNKLFNNNKLFFLASKSNKLPNIVLVIFITFSMLTLTQVASISLIDFLFIAKSNSSGINISIIKEYVNLFLPSFLLILALFEWLIFIEKRPIYTLGLEKINPLKNYAYGLLIGTLMVTLLILILFSTDNLIIEVPHENKLNLISLGYLLLSFFSWMVQSAAEEMLFRGWQMSILAIRYSPFIGIVVSSISFGAIHIFNDNCNVLSIINLTLFGLFMCIFSLKKESIFGACGWHGAWNFVQSNIFGLNVSGIENKYSQTTIFKFNPNTSKLLSGGGFGPEGSLVTTFVFVIAIIIILSTCKKSK